MNVLSLFDYTGEWSAPYLDGGHDVTHVDIKNFVALDINAINSAAIAIEVFGDVDLILAAPPCTDFTTSGAQYWPQKDLDGRTAASVEMVLQVLRLVDLYTPTDPEYLDEFGPLTWAMENPVGRLPTLVPELGQPWYFDPCDFSGYLDLTTSDLMELDRIRQKGGVDVTTEEAEFIVMTNAYTKKTGIWGNFNPPVKRRVEPVKASSQGSYTQRFGGKSERTKAARSVTPTGFAQAFYEANCKLDVGLEFPVWSRGAA